MSDEDLRKGGLYPPIELIQTHSLKIAARIAEHAYMEGKFLFSNFAFGLSAVY